MGQLQQVLPVPNTTTKNAGRNTVGSHASNAVQGRNAGSKPLVNHEQHAVIHTQQQQPQCTPCLSPYEPPVACRELPKGQQHLLQLAPVQGSGSSTQLTHTQLPWLSSLMG